MHLADVSYRISDQPGRYYTNMREGDESEYVVHGREYCRLNSACGKHASGYDEHGSRHGGYTIDPERSVFITLQTLFFSLSDIYPSIVLTPLL